MEVNNEQSSQKNDIQKQFNKVKSKNMSKPEFQEKEIQKEKLQFMRNIFSGQNKKVVKQFFSQFYRKVSTERLKQNNHAEKGFQNQENNDNKYFLTFRLNKNKDQIYDKANINNTNSKGKHNNYQSQTMQTENESNDENASIKKYKNPNLNNNFLLSQLLKMLNGNNNQNINNNYQISNNKRNKTFNIIKAVSQEQATNSSCNKNQTNNNTNNINNNKCFQNVKPNSHKQNKSNTHNQNQNFTREFDSAQRVKTCESEVSLKENPDAQFYQTQKISQITDRIYQKKLKKKQSDILFYHTYRNNNSLTPTTTSAPKKENQQVKRQILKSIKNFSCSSEKQHIHKSTKSSAVKTSNNSNYHSNKKYKQKSGQQNQINKCLSDVKFKAKQDLSSYDMFIQTILKKTNSPQNIRFPFTPQIKQNTANSDTSRQQQNYQTQKKIKSNKLSINQITSNCITPCNNSSIKQIINSKENQDQSDQQKETKMDNNTKTLIDSYVKKIKNLGVIDLKFINNQTKSKLKLNNAKKIKTDVSLSISSNQIEVQHNFQTEKTQNSIEEDNSFNIGSKANKNQDIIDSLNKPNSNLATNDNNIQNKNQSISSNLMKIFKFYLQKQSHYESSDIQNGQQQNYLSTNLQLQQPNQQEQLLIKENIQNNQQQGEQNNYNNSIQDNDENNTQISEQEYFTFSKNNGNNNETSVENVKNSYQQQQLELQNDQIFNQDQQKNFSGSDKNINVLYNNLNKQELAQPSPVALLLQNKYFQQNTSLEQIEEEENVISYSDKKIITKTLIFDLDETLISSYENSDDPSDVKLKLHIQEEQDEQSQQYEIGINIRPFAVETLKNLSQFFEIIVFTASQKSYASAILDYLDPSNTLIDHRLYREQCLKTDDDIHLKDLRIFADRDLKDLLIIDNAAYSFGFQLENGVPIIPFYDNKNDQELRYLSDYLIQFLKCDDVRTQNKLNFKMDQYKGCSDLEAAKLMIYNVFPISDEIKNYQLNDEEEQKKISNYD